MLMQPLNRGHSCDHSFLSRQFVVGIDRQVTRLMPAAYFRHPRPYNTKTAPLLPRSLFLHLPEPHMRSAIIALVLVATSSFGFLPPTSGEDILNLGDPAPKLDVST